MKYVGNSEQVDTCEPLRRPLLFLFLVCHCGGERLSVQCEVKFVPNVLLCEHLLRYRHNHLLVQSGHKKPIGGLVVGLHCLRMWDLISKFGSALFHVCAICGDQALTNEKDYHLDDYGLEKVFI